MIANTILGVAIALQAAQAGTELLPAPTGPHKTGRMTFHWKDSARDELETSARNDKRELMVHVFYPADASAQGNRAAYMPDADAMRPPFNDAQVARITGGDSGSGAQPFLWIQRSLPAPPSAEQLQRARRTRAQYDSVIRVMLAGWDRRLGGVSGGAMRVYIERPGVEHIDFSDEPFWDGQMTPASRPGKLQTIAETRAWVRAFFDGSIRGDWAGLKSMATTRPEVTVRVFGKLWP